MAVIIDGANRLFILTPGTTNINVKDVYSRWKDWVLSGEANWLPAFSESVGGNPIDPGAGTSIPAYLFLINGWRFRPHEADHTLSVTGGVLLVEGGGDPFLDTLGDFTVRINYQQPVQAITVSTGGSAAITPAQIWQYLIEGDKSAEEFLRLIGAALAGKIAGGNTNTITIRSVIDHKDRIVASVDQHGNRTSVALDDAP
jgi:hypothetical protein